MTLFNINISTFPKHSVCVCMCVCVSLYVPLENVILSDSLPSCRVDRFKMGLQARKPGWSHSLILLWQSAIQGWTPITTPSEICLKVMVVIVIMVSEFYSDSGSV